MPYDRPRLHLPSLCLLSLVVACGEGRSHNSDDATGDTLAADDEDSGASAGDETRLDLEGGQEGGGDTDPDCIDPSGNAVTDYKFSVIWIANSQQNTVSRIDTISVTELGRYYTGEANADGRYSHLNPSRTSVNLNGDVVVGNRGHAETDQASFTMIKGDQDLCNDLNGDGVITTSSGPTDILPWGEDECVLWNHKVPGFSGRGVAWDAGELTACGASRDPKVWVTFKGWDHDHHPVVRLLDEWGQIDTDMANATGVEEGVVLDGTYGMDRFGIYGGAVDGEGNFFGTNVWAGGFVRVDREDFSFEYLGPGGYGMGVDADGNPWGAPGGGVVTHDMATGEDGKWAGSIGNQRGMAIDRDGYLWAAMNGPDGLARFDIATKTWVDPTIPFNTADCRRPVGVSIDFEGHVWAVCKDSNTAVKFLPAGPGEGGEVVGVATGFVTPYTYSDMTGGALNLVVNPPVG